MKRVFLWMAILGFSALSTAFSQSTISLDDAVQRGTQYLQGRFPRNTRAAVINVQNDNPELGQYALRALNGALVNSSWFTVVERDASALASITREMNYQMSGDVSDETFQSLGKQLGAEIIISSSLVRSGQN